MADSSGLDVPLFLAVRRGEWRQPFTPLARWRESTKASDCSHKSCAGSVSERRNPVQSDGLSDGCQRPVAIMIRLTDAREPFMLDHNRLDASRGRIDAP